jgi:hypothetical protein
MAAQLPEQGLEAVIETNGDSINVHQLAVFLRLFSAVYAAGAAAIQGKVGNLSVPLSQDRSDLRLGSALIDAFRTAPLDLTALEALAEREDYRLGLVSIRGQNPLGLVFLGVGAALAAAVVISGGEIKWDSTGFRAKLPPLVQGIEALQKVFRSTGPEQIRANAK